MGKSITDVAKQILAESSNPNAATLRPGSKSVDVISSNPGADAPSAPDNEIQDLGPALVSPMGNSPVAKAVNAAKKDTSASSQSRKGTQSGETKQVMEEDVEISEELEDFIEEQIAAGLSEDEIAQAIDENFELVSEEEQLDELRGASNVDSMELFRKRDKQASKAYKDMRSRKEVGDPKGAKASETKGDTFARKANDNYNRVRPMKEEEDYQVDMSEHVEALFAGEDLSEEFKFKATAIFEAAVEQKLAEEIEMLEEAYAETLDEQVAQIQEELSTKVDDYLNYVVEHWVSENEVAIESGLRSELTEDFITGLRNLFAEHYIDIPEDKVSIVEEMTSKVASLEERLNEEIEQNVQFIKQINESKQVEIISDACDGLTVTQSSKLKALSEGLEFTSANEYFQKINILRESYFNTPVSTANVLDNNEVENNGRGMISETTQGPMAQYVKALGKTLPR